MAAHRDPRGATTKTGPPKSGTYATRSLVFFSATSSVAGGVTVSWPSGMRSVVGQATTGRAAARARRSSRQASHARIDRHQRVAARLRMGAGVGFDERGFAGGELQDAVQTERGDPRAGAILRNRNVDRAGLVARERT